MQNVFAPWKPAAVRTRRFAKTFPQTCSRSKNSIANSSRTSSSSNRAATIWRRVVSRELADFTIQVIDVCGGDKIPRKGGPGITQSDLLVINKTDLAVGVGADLDVMAHDSKKMRGNGPFVFAQVKHGVGVDEIIDHIIHAWQHATGVGHDH